MNSKKIFTSLFAPFMENYIHEKELLGFSVKRYLLVMRKFDTFLVQILKDNLCIVASDITGWIATQENNRSTTIYKDMHIISNFCRYMTHLGYECYIPNRSKLKSSYRKAIVFTHQQMDTIFEVCDNMMPKIHTKKTIFFIMPALVRLLYSTGIRIGEALSIKNKDIDFKKKIIIIADTKNSKQRLAPINESLEQVLKQYIEYRNKIPASNVSDPDSHLFVSILGKPCSQVSVYRYFLRIIEKSEIIRNGNNCGPSLHSIRHTTAVHSLIKQTQAGIDLYCSLPSLSVFMGHKSVLGTEYYVRLTQMMYPEILKMDMETTNEIFEYINSKIKENYEEEYN